MNFGFLLDETVFLLQSRDSSRKREVNGGCGSEEEGEGLVLVLKRTHTGRGPGDTFVRVGRKEGKVKTVMMRCWQARHPRRRSPIISWLDLGPCPWGPAGPGTSRWRSGTSFDLSPAAPARWEWMDQRCLRDGDPGVVPFESCCAQCRSETVRGRPGIATQTGSSVPPGSRPALCWTIRCCGYCCSSSFFSSA